jgi:hypothetical protein
MFSSRRCTFVVPGIGTIHGFCASSHANRDLRRRRVLPFRDPGEQPDEGEVRLPCVGIGEARHGVAEVAALQLGRPVDLPGQEAFAERAERHEADAELLERREDRLLRLAPSERVLALKGGHRLHRVRAADRLHAGL